MKAVLILVVLLSCSKGLFSQNCLSPQTSLSIKQVKTTTSLKTIFEELNQSSDIKEGLCQVNTRKLVEKIRDLNPALLKGSEVLILFRFNPKWENEVVSMEATQLDATPYTRNLVATHLKDIGANDYHVHVVLRNNKKIYDLSLAEIKDGIPESEYFEITFNHPEGIENFSKKDVSEAYKSRLVDKLYRYHFKDRKQMLEELRIRPIPAMDYINGYYDKLCEIAGDSPALWLGAEKDYQSVSLGQFLSEESGPLLPEYEQWISTVYVLEDGEFFPYVRYPGGINVYAHPENLLLGELELICNAVTVVSPFFEYGKNFNRTDRDLEVLRKFFFPDSMMDLDKLKDKVVVDMSCGGGLAVEEMRAHGINAFGVDIVLSPRQKKMMMHDTSLANSNRDLRINLNPGKTDQFFIQAHAASTGIATSQVDVLYETYGVFDAYYFGSKRDEGKKFYMSHVIREWKRILKPGGKILISGIDRSYEKEFCDFFNRIPGLRFVRFEVSNRENNENVGAIEIEKIEADPLTRPDLRHWLEQNTSG